MLRNLRHRSHQHCMQQLNFAKHREAKFLKLTLVLTPEAAESWPWAASRSYLRAEPHAEHPWVSPLCTCGQSGGSGLGDAFLGTLISAPRAQRESFPPTSHSLTSFSVSPLQRAQQFPDGKLPTSVHTRDTPLLPQTFFWGKKKKSHFCGTPRSQSTNFASGTYR